MPFLYARFFGILGFLRVLLTKAIGLFRPVVREVSEGDMRVVDHKSCALAAQTFMIAMANEGYDTCPLEGFDSKQMKKLLKLPHGAGVNMVIACGIRDEIKESGVNGAEYFLTKFIIEFNIAPKSQTQNFWGHFSWTHPHNRQTQQRSFYSFFKTLAGFRCITL